ncbi:MAG: M23 family metallopeptidase [Cyanobacteria bacterium P01_A01_bin.114]
MDNLSETSQPVEPRRRCTVTVTEKGWHGARIAAEAAGCRSISELLEKVARGELAIINSDEVVSTFEDSPLPRPLTQPVATQSTQHQTKTVQTQPTPTQPPSSASLSREILREIIHELLQPLRRFPKLVVTGVSATLILMPLLYVVDRTLSEPTVTSDPTASEIPETGDVVGGYDVTDHFRIRPVHPVTGALNVPHNGVDLATPTGTPVHAVGRAGDIVTVDCWWDVDGGGWVADQTASSYPDYVFQSLHLLENECQSGDFKAGDVFALTGNSGLGSGEHYDFRIKIQGKYVPPEKQFLESALTGVPIQGAQRRWLGLF